MLNPKAHDRHARQTLNEAAPGRKLSGEPETIHFRSFIWVAHGRRDRQKSALAARRLTADPARIAGSDVAQWATSNERIKACDFPGSGEQWGNFVQTYSMVGLINAAIRLSVRWDQAF